MCNNFGALCVKKSNAGRCARFNYYNKRGYMIKIQILSTGAVLVSPYIAYNNTNAGRLKVYGFTVPQKDWVWLPVVSYLIHHPKGTILVDAGWDRRISPCGEYDRQAQSIALGSRLLAMVNQGWLPEGQAIDEQLSAVGQCSSDIDYVVITHLDCDHVSGLSQVSRAKHIMVSDAEMQAAGGGNVTNRVRYRDIFWKDIPLTLYQWNSDRGPFGRSYDLFGDHSVELINIPGHSSGLVAVKITNPEGKYVLLTSDGAYSSRNWKEMVLPGIAENRDDQLKSLKWIREQSLSPNCVASLATHDPDVQPGYIEF